MKEKRKPVRFEIEAGEGREVYLAGSFNDWNPREIRLTPVSGDGLYGTTVRLPKGRHEYKFVVNDTWVTDPSAAENVQNNLGVQNSVVEVS